MNRNTTTQQNEQNLRSSSSRTNTTTQQNEQKCAVVVGQIRRHNKMTTAQQNEQKCAAVAVAVVVSMIFQRFGAFGAETLSL